MVPWYSLQSKGIGHTSAINCLAFSPTGHKLASGDDEGNVFIWTCVDGKQLQNIALYRHGAISYLLWVARDTKHGDALLFVGCADGSIHLWIDKLPAEHLFSHWVMEAHPKAVQCLAYDATHRRLASTAGWTAAMWDFDSDWNMGIVWRNVLDVKALALSTYFVDGGVYLITCYLESREIIRFHTDDGSITNRRALSHRIGSTALSSDGDFLAVGDLATGVRLYQTSTLHTLRTYPQRIRVNVIKQLAFANYQELIVTGSDDGIIVIYKTVTGEPHQMLRHSTANDLTQTLTSYSSAQLLQIASASSASGSGNFVIKLWRCAEVTGTYYKFLTRWKTSLRLICAFVPVFAAYILLRGHWDIVDTLGNRIKSNIPI